MELTIPPLTKPYAIDLGPDADGNPQKLTLHWKINALSIEQLEPFQVMELEYNEAREARINAATHKANEEKKAARELADAQAAASAAPSSRRKKAAPATETVERYARLYAALDTLQASITQAQAQSESPEVWDSVQEQVNAVAAFNLQLQQWPELTDEQLAARGEAARRDSAEQLAEIRHEAGFQAKRLAHLLYKVKFNDAPAVAATPELLLQLLSLNGLRQAIRGILEEMQAPLGTVGIVN